MIQNIFIIFIPLDKYGKDDYKKNRIIYDSGYIHSIEIVKLNKSWVYRIYRDNGLAIYLNVKSYRLSLGVNK